MCVNTIMRCGCLSEYTPEKRAHVKIASRIVSYRNTLHACRPTTTAEWGLRYRCILGLNCSYMSETTKRNIGEYEYIQVYSLRWTLELCLWVNITVGESCYFTHPVERRPKLRFRLCIACSCKYLKFRNWYLHLTGLRDDECFVTGHHVSMCRLIRSNLEDFRWKPLGTCNPGLVTWISLSHLHL